MAGRSGGSVTALLQKVSPRQALAVLKSCFAFWFSASLQNDCCNRNPSKFDACRYKCLWLKNITKKIILIENILHAYLFGLFWMTKLNRGHLLCSKIKRSLHSADFLFNSCSWILISRKNLHSSTHFTFMGYIIFVRHFQRVISFISEGREEGKMFRSIIWLGLVQCYITVKYIKKFKRNFILIVIKTSA